jgi:hypothetical protein
MGVTFLRRRRNDRSIGGSIEIASTLGNGQSGVVDLPDLADLPEPRVRNILIYFERTGIPAAMANGKFYVLVCKDGDAFLKLKKDELHSAFRQSDDALVYDYSRIPSHILIAVPEEAGKNWADNRMKVAYLFHTTWRSATAEDEALLGELKPGIDFSYSYKG